MLDRSESAKAQLAEAHKYVQAFLTARFTFFGVMLAGLGTLVSLIANMKNDPQGGLDEAWKSRLGAWIIVLAVHLLGAQAILSASRAIWLFCCHMFLLERDYYGPGGNHQWLLTNLRNKQYSTNYGLYKALVFLPVGTLAFFLADLVVRTPDTVDRTTQVSVAVVGILVWTAIILFTCSRLEPCSLIEQAADQAIQNQCEIDQMEQSSSELLDDGRWPRPYVKLLKYHRSVRPVDPE